MKTHKAFTLIELPAMRKGFTLIELLVVVTIIVALLAILLPSMSRAVAAAETAVCASNLRQLNVALTGYVMDRHGWFPGQWVGKSSWGKFWMHQIEPYHSDLQEVRVCPAAPPNPTSTWGTATLGWNGQFAGTPGFLHQGDEWKAGSYGLNAWLYSNEKADLFESKAYFSNHFRRLSNIDLIAQTPFFADCIWVDGFPKVTDGPTSRLDGNYGSPGAQPHTARFTIDRHAMSINIALGDGAVLRNDLADIHRVNWNLGFTQGDYALPAN